MNKQEIIEKYNNGEILTEEECKLIGVSIGGMMVRKLINAYCERKGDENE